MTNRDAYPLSLRHQAVKIAQSASADAAAASGHHVDCDCASCCLVRAESYRVQISRAVADLEDAVLEAMIPGIAMSAMEILGRIEREHAPACAGLKCDDVGATLTGLNYANAEGREVQIGVDGDTYTRPIVAGMGATYGIGSDRYAVTVVAVSPTGRKVTTRDDRATRLDKNGMSEDQSYAYERDPRGGERTFYRDAGGRYGNKTHGGHLALGVRRAYHDYSF